MITADSFLLKEFQEYDSLNQDSAHPLIKILVSYIKPSFLFKSAILTPIQLGKAVEHTDCKDGIQSEKDLKWLHENCDFNDDFEGGISKYNRRIGFLTGTYWAWKNYDKLGDPQYFGSFGYRKLLAPTFLKNLQGYDVIAPKREIFSYSVKHQFIAYHGQEVFDAMMNVFHQLYPEEQEMFQTYLNQNWGYFYEIYVMKSKLFMDFCGWIFKYLEAIFKAYPNFINMAFDFNQPEVLRAMSFLELSQEEFKQTFCPKTLGQEQRDIGFIIERLTGYYLYKLSLNKNIKFVEVPVIHTETEGRGTYQQMVLHKIRSKVCAENMHESKVSPQATKIPVFLPADDGYSPFVATTMVSILDHTKSFVNFYILDAGISVANQEKILQIPNRFPNCSVEFLKIDTDTVFKNFSTTFFSSLAIYSRMLIPILKPEIQKALYIDVDVIVLGDIASLYAIDLDHYDVAFVPDIPFFLIRRIKEKLHIAKEHVYFNAGVMLLDSEKWRKKGIGQKLLDIAKRECDNLILPDQDVLNKFFENNYKILDAKFNVMGARDEIVIRHFAGSIKPWYFSASVATALMPNIADFWRYVPLSGFEREIQAFVKDDATQQRLLRKLQIEKIFRSV